MRHAGLILVAGFVVLLAVLTLVEVSRNGLGPLSVISILIVVMFVIGLLGALRNPPGA